MDNSGSLPSVLIHTSSPLRMEAAIGLIFSLHLPSTPFGTLSRFHLSFFTSPSVHQQCFHPTAKSASSVPFIRASSGRLETRTKQLIRTPMSPILARSRIQLCSTPAITTAATPFPMQADAGTAVPNVVIRATDGTLLLSRWNRKFIRNINDKLCNNFEQTSQGQFGSQNSLLSACLCCVVHFITHCLACVCCPSLVLEGLWCWTVYAPYAKNTVLLAHMVAPLLLFLVIVQFAFAPNIHTKFGLRSSIFDIQRLRRVLPKDRRARSRVVSDELHTPISSPSTLHLRHCSSHGIPAAQPYIVLVSTWARSSSGNHLISFPAGLLVLSALSRTVLVATVSRSTSLFQWYPPLTIGTANTVSLNTPTSGLKVATAPGNAVRFPQISTTSSRNALRQQRAA
ncbi:uncharacterized protein CLUP02_17693 [Colletotrichum lupini]|uniref:Uncharacterized protein n=1 Tax=Colletotrichum lupini TaxID=145971 RepID=A0A9Q8SFS2_9PEZI|nr:uncharacterized protein CLUP02_17693 [Colletotrichum lupini]UQC76180.1 hypothetical protein CLUP02_17693 [Colletotrichum lupini]